MSECRFSETLHACGSAPLSREEAVPLFGLTQWRAYTVQRVVVAIVGDTTSALKGEI